MSIKRFRPITPSLRSRAVVDKKDLFSGRPFKKLVVSKIRSSGRSSSGRISVRHKGGGHKRNYRIIDFIQNKIGIEGVVERLEYDPNRSAYIALVLYVDGDRRYIIAQDGLKVGSKIIASSKDDIKEGNNLKLADIPSGTDISCLEMYPGRGAVIARSAGCFCQLLAKDDGMAVIRLRSGEMRKFSLECRASIGKVSNSEHMLRRLGKAGAKRWIGVRPTVRGVAMNPVDHPHGGGEGRTSGGRHPVTPWGVPTKGYKTRNKKKFNKLILSKRK
jgi:large subunit ribosomal protein L2